MDAALKTLKNAVGATIHGTQQGFYRCKVLASGATGVVVEEQGKKLFIPWTSIQYVEFLDTLEDPKIEITGLDL